MGHDRFQPLCERGNRIPAAHLADPHRDRHAIGNQDRDAYCHGDDHAHRNDYGYGHAYIDTYGDRDPHGYCYGHRYNDSHQDADHHSGSDSYYDCNANADADRDAYANGHAHGNGDGGRERIDNPDDAELWISTGRQVRDHSSSDS